MAWTRWTDQDWTGYTPSVTQSVAVTSTVATARYTQNGKTVTGMFYVTATSSGTTNNAVLCTLPVAPAASVVSLACGGGIIYDASSSKIYTVKAIIENGANKTIAFFSDDSLGSYFGQQPNLAIANTDQIRIFFEYEAA